MNKEPAKAEIRRIMHLYNSTHARYPGYTSSQRSAYLDGIMDTLEGHLVSIEYYNYIESMLRRLLHTD